MGSKVKISFYPIDVDFSEVENGTALRVFGFTPEGKKIVLLAKGFKPYFYATIREGLPAEQVAAKISAQEFEYKGRKLKMRAEKISGMELKIFTEFPTDVPVAQDFIKRLDEIDKTYEFDIKFFKRFMLDSGILPFALHEATCEPAGKLGDCEVFETETIKTISTAVLAPKILAFDIETLSAGQQPNTKTDSIIMASFYGENYKKVIAWKRFNAPDYVQFVDGERELIEEFIKTVRAFSPHVLVGYGSDHFDFPFLRERAAKYNLRLNINYDGSEVFINTKGRHAAKTTGLQHLDISHFIRNIVSIETSRFKLDAVAKELIGKGKSKTVDPALISEIWSSNDAGQLQNLAEYNLIDSQLTFEIAKKILPTQMQLLKMLGLNLYEINRMTYGQLVEWFLINNAIKSKTRFPPKPRAFQVFERRKQTYTGAFVVEPTPGFYKNLCVFDFRSLYPSIIASHNISPETINCKCCRGLKIVKLETGEEFWFCTNKKGFFSELISDLIERRKRINEILITTNPQDSAFAELQARQHALKYIANSMYGYLGFAGSRWYSIECAKAITALGRQYIQDVIKEANKFGLRVIYGDTDSLFIDNVNKEQAKQFLQIINTVLPKPMELELKGAYSSGLFLERKTGEKGAKKRYALLSESGSIIMKGLEAVRGDWSKLAKKAQKKVIELVLKTGNVEKSAEFIQNLIKDVNNKKIPLDDFIINVKLTKDLRDYANISPHVAAATLANQKGMPIGRGSVVSYVVTKGESDKISDRVKLAEDASVNEIDSDYYIESQILRAVFKIFEVFGYAVENFKTGQMRLA